VYTYTYNDAAVEAVALGETPVDNFTMFVTDGDDANVTDTFTVTINGNNDAPTAGDAGDTDTGAIQETNATNLIASGVLTANDVDASDQLTATVTVSAAGDGGMIAGEAGFLTINGGAPFNPADGSVQNVPWTFNSGAETYNSLAEGETRTLTYTVTYTDDNGVSSLTATDTVTIVITGSNDTPTIDVVGANGDSNSTVLTEGAGSNDLVGDTGTLTVTDLDITDELTITVAAPRAVINDTGAQNGITTNISTGLQADIDAAALNVSPDPAVVGALTTETVTWEFAPAAGSQFDELQAGDTLTLEYDITVNDGNGGTDLETISIVINGTNDAVAITGYANTTGAVLELGAAPASENASSQTVTVDGKLALTDLDVGDLLTPDAINGVVLTTTTGANGRDLSSDAAFSAAVSSGQASIVGLAEDTDVTFAPVTDVSNGGVVNFNWQYTNTADFDWLRSGETLTVEYDTTATDGLTTDTKVDQLVVQIVGTNDSLTNFADVDGTLAHTETDSPENVTETTTLSVRDQDVGDTITFAATADATVQLNGDTLGAVLGALAADDDVTASTLDDQANLSIADATSNGTDVTTTATYEEAGADLDWLRQNDVLTLDYDVQISDGQGSTITETVTMTFTGVNDDFVIDTVVNPADIAETDPQAQSVADQAGTFNVTDPDVGDVLDYTFSDATVTWFDDGGVNITASTTDYNAVFNALGAAANLDFGGTDLTAGTGDAVTVDWDWSLDGATVNLDFLDDGERIEVDYLVTVSDGTFSDTVTVNLTFTGTNDAPVIDTSTSGDSAAGAVTEGDFNSAAAEATGTLTVFDVDRTDVVSLQGITADVNTSSTFLTNGGTQTELDTATLDDATLATLLSIALPNDANTPTQVEWQFNTTAANQFDLLAEGETLVIDYTITVQDDNGVTDTQDVVITVTGTNDAPTLVVNRALVDDDSISLTASDPDLNDLLQLEVAVGGVQDIVNNGSAQTDFDVEEQGAIKVTDLIVEDPYGAQGDSGYVLIEGTATGDTMSAVASGNGIYFGFGGDDDITGGAGQDIINGGEGADVMTGGDGDGVEDQFYFSDADFVDATGSVFSSRVVEFDNGVDRILHFDDAAAGGINSTTANDRIILDADINGQQYTAGSFSSFGTITITSDDTLDFVDGATAGVYQAQGTYDDTAGTFTFGTTATDVDFLLVEGATAGTGVSLVGLNMLVFDNDLPTP
jgi:VCBS repeat-containing protein